MIYLINIIFRIKINYIFNFSFKKLNVIFKMNSILKVTIFLYKNDEFNFNENIQKCSFDFKKQ